MLRNAICKGYVTHCRRVPVLHKFKYPQAMLLMNIDSIRSLFAKNIFWSTHRFNLVQFKDNDYIAGRTTIKKAVIEKIKADTGNEFIGDVYILTQPRSWGTCFNPVTFYFCKAKAGDGIQYIVAEINNTPWGERHAYVLEVASMQEESSVYSFEFDKTFHVSPFMPMAVRYKWHFEFVDDHIAIRMNLLDKNIEIFSAFMQLQQKPFTYFNMLGFVLAYPFMGLNTLRRIYWQALLLWLKRTPFFTHPDKISKEVRLDP